MVSIYVLGEVEGRFADLIWENEPLSSRSLAELAAETLQWKRTTAYTVLRKLCDKGLFANDGGQVSSRISRDEYYGARGKQFVQEAFGGSLPLFLAAFAKAEALDAADVEALRALIDRHKEEKP